MIVASELDLDRFIPAGSGERLIEFEVWSYFYDNGYPIESIDELHAVVNRKRDDEDSGYLVAKVTTLDKPVDVADAAVDQTQMYCCSCPAYQFHHNVDLEEDRITEWESCKHVRKVDKVERAENDDQQARLVE